MSPLRPSLLILIIFWGVSTGQSQGLAPRSSSFDSSNYTNPLLRFNNPFNIIRKQAMLIHQYENLYVKVKRIQDSNYDSCLIYITKAHQLAIELSDTFKIAETNYTIGVFYRRKCDYFPAMEYLNKSLSISRKHSFDRLTKYTLNCIGLIHIEQARYDNALAFLLESLELREKEGDKAAISVAELNMGLVYYKLGNNRAALDCFERALKLMNETEDNSRAEVTMINSSLCYVDLGECKKAEHALNEAFELYQGRFRNHTFMSWWLAKGNLALRTGDFQQAISHYNKSLAYSKLENNRRFQLDNYLALADCYLKMNNLPKAVEVLSSANSEEMLKSTSNLELMKLYKKLVDVYTKKNNIERAFEFQTKYITIRDSIYNDELAANLMKIQGEYQKKLLSSQLQAKNQVISLREGTIDKQQQINRLIVFVAVVLAILIILLVRNIQQRKSINGLLRERVLERTLQLQLNNDELVKIREERDLLVDKSTNDIKSNLASLQGLCEIAKKEITDPLGKEYLRRVERLSQNLTNNLYALTDTR